MYVFLHKIEFWTAKIAFSLENKRGVGKIVFMADSLLPVTFSSSSYYTSKYLKVMATKSMRIMAFISILFWAINGIAQKASDHVIEEPVTIDNRQPDTAAQHHLNWLLELPPALTVISCEFLLNSSGEIFKASWSVNESGKWATIQALMNRAKPKDMLIFTGIYVMKRDKRMKLADKIIEIK
jgi:hypothetical protein